MKEVKMSDRTVVPVLCKLGHRTDITTTLDALDSGEPLSYFCNPCGSLVELKNHDQKRKTPGSTSRHD